MPKEKRLPEEVQKVKDEILVEGASYHQPERSGRIEHAQTCRPTARDLHDHLQLL